MKMAKDIRRSVEKVNPSIRLPFSKKMVKNETFSKRYATFEGFNFISLEIF